MKKWIAKQSIFVYLFCILFLVFGITSIYAQTETPTPTPTPGSSSNSNSADLQKTIDELQSKVNELQGEKKTLSSQIGVMDGQIKLTQLRINATQNDIAVLTDDIDTASDKISHLEDSLNNLTKVLANRIVATYQAGDVQPLALLFSSNGLSDYLQRSNYLKIVQEHDKQLVYDTQQAKTDYANQKEIFEAKKQKIELLKKQLEGYTAKLDQDKKDKQALLITTQNNEAVYQQKLQAALAEQQAISQISSGGGNAVAVGHVSQGDVVGHIIIGRSACSSGTHLHFEVHNGGSVQDPAGFLSNKSISFDNSPDPTFGFSGSWNWPLEDPISIFQGYGMTYWARTGWYGGGPHTGIDMGSGNSNAVHAVKEGELFRGGIACGGGQLLFARVDHSDGTQALYLHIVP